MGSCLPIGAIIGNAAIMDSAATGTIGGTYIGNPVSCVASIATIQYMKDINLNDKAKHVGGIIVDRFKKMQEKHASIGDVRGLGAMIAMEFVKNNDPQQPDYETCNALIKACAKRDLIIISAGVNKNVLRILCPLVISDELLNKGLTIIEEELDEIIEE